MVESFYLHRSHSYLSTIQNDFDKCHTIGYVGADNVTEEEGTGIATSIATSIANPSIDEQTINSTIAQKVSGAIDSAHGLNHPMGTIKRDFGMHLAEWQCIHPGIFD